MLHYIAPIEVLSKGVVELPSGGGPPVAESGICVDVVVSAGALAAAVGGIPLPEGGAWLTVGVSMGVPVAAVSEVTVTVTVVVKAPAVWHCDMAV